MLDLLKPYLMYAKIAAAAAALLAAVAATHEWDRRGYEADKAKSISDAAASYEDSVAVYKQRIAELESAREKLVTEYRAKIVRATTDNQKLTRDIANATKNQPACTFTAGFSGVWNDSIDRANGKGVSADSTNTDGTISADGRVTEITRADLLTNHDAVTQICGRWKAQLDSIIEWDKKNK